MQSAAQRIHPSPRQKTVLADELADVRVAPPLRDVPEQVGADARVPEPHLRLRLGREVAEAGVQHARADGPGLDAVGLELVAPVQHQHVERRLAAAVADGLEVDPLRPAGGLRRRREVRLGRLRDVRQAGHEDQPRLGRPEQQRHERRS